MPIISDFYIILGVLLLIIFVLQISNFSFMQKAGILVAITLALLWVERPEWFVDLLRKVGIY
jgi:hypothetical protein